MVEQSKRYSEELKEQIVRELESGEHSRNEICKEYGLPKSLLAFWVKEYGKYKPEKSIMEVVMKSEKEKISELEKAMKLPQSAKSSK